MNYDSILTKILIKQNRLNLSHYNRLIRSNKLTNIKEYLTYRYKDFTNYKEIKYRIWMNSNICDCCGKALDKFPWKTKYGLCDECNDFHYKKDKVIWRNNIIKIKEEKLNRICWR